MGFLKLKDLLALAHISNLPIEGLGFTILYDTSSVGLIIVLI